MSKPNFTPGPWEIAVIQGSESSPMITNTHAEEVICNVRVDVERDWESNAALIAAAPELYEALEAVLQADITGGHDDLHYKIIDTLKRARGES